MPVALTHIAAEHQHRLFKKLVDYRFEIDSLFGSSSVSSSSLGEEDVWLHALRSSAQELRKRALLMCVVYDAAALRTSKSFKREGHSSRECQTGKGTVAFCPLASGTAISAMVA